MLFYEGSLSQFLLSQPRPSCMKRIYFLMVFAMMFSTHTLYGQLYNPKDVYVVGQDACIQSLVFAPFGKKLITGSWDSHMKVWQLLQVPTLIKDTGENIDAVEFVDISPDGKIAAVAVDSVVQIWDMTKYYLKTSFSSGKEIVSTIAFSPDGKKLAVGYLSRTGMIRIWDMASEEIFLQIDAHSGFVSDLEYSKSGEFLISASWDTKIKLWDVKSGLMVRVFEGHTNHVKSISLSEDMKTLISGGDDKTVRVWDFETTQEIKVLKEHRGGINSVDISNGSEYFVAGGEDNLIVVWDMRSFERINRLVGHTSSVQVVAFDPSNGRIASGSRDGSLRIWSNYAPSSED